MISVPAGLSPGVRVPCWLCGDLLHQVANESTDEFTWADETGHTTGTDSDLRPLEQHGGAYAYLAWLDAELERLHKLSRKRKDGYHWPDEQTRATYFARAREYTTLKVRLDMKGTFHIHRAKASDIPQWCGPYPPECCGWPGWLRPSGWWCRQCKRQLGAGGGP